jgi:hypothetical protein
MKSKEKKRGYREVSGDFVKVIRCRSTGGRLKDPWRDRDSSLNAH